METCLRRLNPNSYQTHQHKTYRLTPDSQALTKQSPLDLTIDTTRA
jgi:hypothetical protein